MSAKPTPAVPEAHDANAAQRDEDREYTVTWTIDLGATSPRAAAEAALAIQRNRRSLTGVFDVRPVGEDTTTRVDLDDTAPETRAGKA